MCVVLTHVNEFIERLERGDARLVRISAQQTKVT